MRGGLRLQILLVLGGLLVLSFVPLFHAVATYTHVSLQQIRAAHARSLGRAVAVHVAEARAQRSSAELLPLLKAELGASVEAIGVYGRDGASVAQAFADPAARELLFSRAENREEVEELVHLRRARMRVTIPSREGAVVALIRTDDQRTRSESLVRLLGLYMALVALLLLVVGYFTLTRLIVRPLDALGRAAERVASGARRLHVPPTSVRELAELGASLRTMTERLIREEDLLRGQIDEVERATQRLKEAQDRLVRSERLASVGRLAAGLAHEIGNPIAALVGLQELLLAGGLSADEERDFLQRMRKETERIHGILRDLLQFARPAASHGTPGAPGPGDVEAAIADTVALLAPQRALEAVDLRVSVEADLPSVTLGNERLMQVLLNLLMNAADAVASHGHVSVTAEACAAGVRVTVEDDGPGVDRSVRHHLFEPFVTTKEVGKGTGLGLAVCRGLVESAGGSIAFDGDRARGARFVVELPRSSSNAFTRADRDAGE